MVKKERIGDQMPDGTVYAGLSPTTGKQIFVMPASAGVIMSFNNAVKYTKKLNNEKLLGHDDWRLPTKAELDALFRNKDKRALKNIFAATQQPAACGAHIYWSSDPSGLGKVYGQGQSFMSGRKFTFEKKNGASVCYVR